MGGVQGGYGEGLSIVLKEVLANHPAALGKQGLAQAVFSWEGELLTQTGDAVGRWKEHFEELLNLMNTSSAEEAESEDSREDSFISRTEVTKVVKKQSARGGQNSPGDAEGSGHCRAVLTCTPFQCHMEVGDSTSVVADLDGGSHLQERGPEGVLQLLGYHTSQPSLESFYRGAGKEAPADS